MQNIIPTADEVGEVVARIRSWQCVEPDERVALRNAVAMLPLAARGEQSPPKVQVISCAGPSA